jgi:RNA polymerase sigma factor for flagellar operon FliA
MATQFVSTSHPLSSSAAAPALCGRKMTRLVPTSRIMRPRKRREEKPIQDREKLVVDMLPLVKRVALKIRKRLPAQVEIDDLLSDGVVGLVDAVAKFNPRKRVKLESYARHRIRGSILDGLRGADPVPRDLRRKHKNFQKLSQELEADLGRPVKDEEMATGMGMTVAQWHHELNEIQSAGIDCGARTLSAGPTFMQTSVEPAFLAGDASNAFDLCYLREQREILALSLSQLRERERQIITLYYQRGLTMQEIASRMKVDASRVSQLHAAALVRLKAKVDSLIHRGQVETSETGGLSLAAGAGA